MASVVDIKVDRNNLIPIDNFFMLLHPVQRYSRIIYLDFHRVNNRFAFPNLKILWLGIIIYTCDVIGHIIKLAILVRANKLSAAQTEAAVMTMGMCGFSRGLLLLLKQKQIAKMANDLDLIYPKTLHLQRLMKVHEVVEGIQAHYKYLYPYVTFVLFVFYTMPLFKFFLFYESGNPVTDEFHQQTAWLPFNLREREDAYPYVYMYENLHSTCGATFLMAFDTVSQMFTRLICMHYAFLNQLITDLDVTHSNHPILCKKFYERLYECIVYHQHINSLGKDLNDIFGFIILASNMIWSLSICFHINIIVNTDDLLEKLVFIFTCMAMVYLAYDISKLGAFLETETSKLRDTLYGQNWFESAKKYRSIHYIMLKYANYPLIFDCLGLFTVNMEHFKSILMMAYNLFTFLQSRR